MIKVGQRSVFPGISWIRCRLRAISLAPSRPQLDVETMPEWQKRDLGFRDGRVNIHDDIWRR